MPSARTCPPLTPALIDKLVAALRAGNYRCVAAAYAGLSPRQLRSFLHRGRDPQSGAYHRLRRAVTVLQKHMTDDWRATIAYLERRHPSRWSKHRPDDPTPPRAPKPPAPPPPNRPPRDLVEEEHRLAEILRILVDVLPPEDFGRALLDVAQSRGLLLAPADSHPPEIVP